MSRQNWTRRSVLAVGAAAPFILTSGRAGAATTLRWASVLAPTHPSAIMMERVAKEVKEKTGGSLDIQTFPSGQLGGSRDLIEATSGGAIQIVDEGAAQFGQFVPAMSILEAPYIWRDAAHLRKVLTSALVDEFNAILADKRHMRVIGATYYGKRHLTSGSKPVAKAADLVGFKLRIPEVDTFRAMAEAWGARPTPLNFNELYLALSQGAVDGQENPLPTIQSGKIFEVQKYLVLTGHVITPRLIAINEPVWKALSSTEQTVLRDSIAKFGKQQDDEIEDQESKLVATFKAAGMTIVTPDPDEFRKPVLAAVPAKFEAKWGKGLWDRIAGM
jgi:tripartite ATP-independent transporter DctP family solute receptor